MVTRKTKIIAGSGAGVLLAAAGVWYGFTLFAAQGQGTLAQAPLNVQVTTPPSFIMAVDNSGSMTFQTQFPGKDGQVCWNRDRQSFFLANGSMSLSGNCNYTFVMMGTRGGTSGIRLPPLDLYGFARSARYNPSYYDPTIKYEPWINSSLGSYGNASLTATKIDPREAATVNLASNYFDTSNDGAYRMQTGMVIPAGTRYSYDGYIYNNRNGTTWTAGAQGAGLEYWPATFFMPWTSANDARPQLAGTANAYANVTRTKVDNACGNGCHMWKYTIQGTDTAALQNFANWFSYYGNRNRAMIAGMTHSMVDVNNMYVGYFRIGQHGSYDSSTDSRKRLAIYDMAASTDKKTLYDSMISLTAGGGTPNRQAVNAAGLQFQRTDTNAPVKLACQKNAVMLFTDGYSNADSPSSTNTDGNMGAPFSDNHSGTMADIMSTYYISPLRTDMQAGQVKVPSGCSAANPDPKLDCNANLHVNFYGVTLGARGNLYNPDNVQDPYTTPAIYNNWPAMENDNLTTVDDIWHATVNTRGEYINARTPADITTAMRRVLSSVQTGAQTSGSQALTGARIGTGTLTVEPSYEIANEGTDWFSRLQAASVALNDDRVAEYTDSWEAAAKLATNTARRIIVSKAGTAGNFDASNITLADLCTKPSGLYTGMSRCTAADITALGGTTNALSDAINYLRGTTTLEVRNSGGRYRTRSTLLGDIVNSSPTISSPLDDYGYRRLGGELSTSYNDFLATKRESGRYMVYVGANDGMLHAFDGGMDAEGETDDNGGVERFAYIPATALGHMGNLLFPYKLADKTDQKFQHRYYVDGPTVVADAQVSGNWATTLVGTAGAGGRSVFGLNVTSPSTFAATDRLWEISDVNTSLSQAIRSNIGHVLSKPVIVPVREGSGVAWKAIFGNGYNSASGKAVLFVVDMTSGATRMIEAIEDTATAPSGTNGLGSVLVVDRWRPNTGDNAATQPWVRGRDGLADTVYAADQRGAMWKFDLTSSAESITAPLFTTARQTNAQTNVTYRQPILGGMTAVTGLGDGVMLLFGTGAFSFTSDPTDVSAQSLYGVNDTGTWGSTTTLTPSNLLPYTVVTDDDTGGRSLAVGTMTGVAQGWSIALPASGERFVGNPTVAAGVVFMPTYVPNAGGVGCSTDGSNWLFGLNPLSGSAALSSSRVGAPDGDSPGEGAAAVPLKTGGTAPVKDVNVAVVPRVPGGGPGGNACWMTINVAGSDPLYMPYPCGRQSWRQIQ